MLRRPSNRRTSDMVLPEPYVAEWHYRIVPPPGFVVRPLPNSGKEQLGPALLSKEFAIAPDGVVTAILCFDTVKRRFTPKETEALQAAVRALREAEPLVVSFEQKGQAFMAFGRIREALGQFETLIALHPQEALHHSQIAMALLEAGIGEAAREEARRAVTLEPTSTIAYQTLGWILQHDLWGRRFKKGSDLAGAEVAYRKTKELDPSDMATRGNLAILFEHNVQGIRYGPGARLDEAIAEYQSMQEGLEESGLADNLAVALMWARRFAELREATLKLKPSPTRRALLLVASTTTAGTAAAIKEASKDIPEDETRRQALLDASNLLLQLRLYREAADLLAAGARNHSEGAALLSRAELLRKTRRHEEMHYSDSDPRSVVMKFFETLFATDSIGEETFGLFSRQAGKQIREAGRLQSLRRPLRSLRSALTRTGLPVEVAVDFTLAAMEMKAEGNDALGYRIRAKGPMGRGGALTFFVVREDLQYHILGSTGNLTAVGDEALARIDKGDLAVARHWLDWAREEETLGGGDDPLAGPPFAHLWTRGPSGDQDAARYAAAALMSGSPRAEIATSLLREGRERARPADRIRFDLALASILAASKKYEDLLAVAHRLVTAAPDSRTAFGWLTLTLTRLKRWHECEQAVAERLKRLPEDADATRALAEAARQQGDAGKAHRLGLQLVTAGQAEAVDLNNLAWYALVLGSLTDEAL